MKRSMLEPVSQLPPCKKRLRFPKDKRKRCKTLSYNFRCFFPQVLPNKLRELEEKKSCEVLCVRNHDRYVILMWRKDKSIEMSNGCMTLQKLLGHVVGDVEVFNKKENVVAFRDKVFPYTIDCDRIIYSSRHLLEIVVEGRGNLFYLNVLYLMEFFLPAGGQGPGPSSHSVDLSGGSSKTLSSSSTGRAG